MEDDDRDEDERGEAELDDGIGQALGDVRHRGVGIGGKDGLALGEEERAHRRTGMIREPAEL